MTSYEAKRAEVYMVRDDLSKSRSLVADLYSLGSEGEFVARLIADQLNTVYGIAYAEGSSSGFSQGYDEGFRDGTNSMGMV